MEFREFKKLVDISFQQMTIGQSQLFRVSVSKEDLWTAYLYGFPESERQSHNCNCCRQFIKNYGNVVAIQNNKVITFWDIECSNEIYQNVANKLAELVKSAKVSSLFVQKFPKLGTDFNVVEGANKEIIRWNHLYTVLPNHLLYKGSESEEAIAGKFRTTALVFLRSLTELSKDSIETALDLIAQGSLYRGEEFKAALERFQIIQNQFLAITSENEKRNFAFSHAEDAGALARLRNMAIGTLLEDLTLGVDLDTAVTKFERVMAPTNYKRPKPLITKGMIEQAQKKVEELGLADSLPRRHARVNDITINNVLFANRDAAKAMGVFDVLKEDISVNPKKYSKVEEVGIEDFVKNILPKAASIELLMENRHCGNLMTLTAPVNPEAKRLFNWNTNFAWVYNGNVTDSIKDKVEFYGGKTSGVLRMSLAWLGLTDLDLHVIEPNGTEVYYSNKQGHGGRLDLDMNGLDKSSETPVENVIYTDKSRMQEGVYRMFVNVYSIREQAPDSFEAEIECEGELFEFSHKFQDIRIGMNVEVARFEYSKQNGIKILSSLNGSGSTIGKEEWGIKTNTFQKVSLMMYSPNHWEGNNVGNKHYFFILEGCKNPNTIRGFFNEFLKPELLEHKRVFEALGDKMKIEYSDDQLSGLGFSSTVRNSIICKVKGSFERIIKINF